MSKMKSRYDKIMCATWALHMFGGDIDHLLGGGSLFCFHSYEDICE